jgi:hypothetical protein
VIAPLGCCPQLGDDTSLSLSYPSDPAPDMLPIGDTFPLDTSTLSDPSLDPLTGAPIDSGVNNPLLSPSPIGGGVNLLDPNNPFIQNPAAIGGGSMSAAQIAALLAAGGSLATGALNAANTPAPAYVNSVPTAPVSSFSSWLAAQSLMSGVSNEALLIGGVAGVLVLSVLMSGKKSSGRKK